MRSDKIKKGADRAPHRSLLKALGLTDDEIAKPLIGICSSANEIIPGHMHLEKIEEAVKAGVYSAGGTPLKFSTIGICDGLAMGHNGMKYSLPSRDLIADSIEIVANATPFDGLAFISNCDKITPAMLMAMGRLNIPSVIISGGPMLTGSFRGKSCDLVTAFEAVGKHSRGEITISELSELENCACPGAGSCAGLFTANTMNSISEALGVALKGNGTIPAVNSARIRLAKETGRTLMALVSENIKPRDIVDERSFYNAILLDLSLGGSTNAVLHLTAIAEEFGINLNLDSFDSLAEKTPQLCALSPVGVHHMEDLNRAGGIYAVLKRLFDLRLLNPGAKTIVNQPIGKLIKDITIEDEEVIKPINDPVDTEGGLAIIYGNLAESGSVVKRKGIPRELKEHTGPSKVFEDEESATEAILKGKIEKGDVIVIRNEGPVGGPGMREMLSPTSALSGTGLLSDVILITDRRFSGGSTGAVIGHISPEAAEGGLISLVNTGDPIKFSLKNRELNLMIPKEAINRRRNNRIMKNTTKKSKFFDKYPGKINNNVIFLTGGMNGKKNKNL